MPNTDYSVDAHTHIFCWGEKPEEGFLSKRTQKSLIARLLLRLVGVHKEPGETISEKICHRLFRDIESTKLDYIVLFAQDAIYKAGGEIDFDRTHFYVSNDYVLELAKRSDKIIPCTSINPSRIDAIQELDRIRDAGCRLVKIHTAIQGVSPDLPDFEQFYRHAAELGITLIFHTGYEHSCKIVSQKFTDPKRLSRALDQGGNIIAAHCGTCAFWDREDYYPHFIEMMKQYDNLYGDTAVMAGSVRLNACGKLSAEDESIRSRILHGSDYPIPPSWLMHRRHVGMFPRSRKNILDLNIDIKRGYKFGTRYENLILDLIEFTDTRLPTEDPTQLASGGRQPSGARR